MKIDGPNDFLLGEWDGRGDALPIIPKPRYLPECFLELAFELSRPEALFGDDDVVLAEGTAPDAEGWKLTLDRYSFVFVCTSGEAPLSVKSKVMLCQFATPRFSIGAAINNFPYAMRHNKRWEENVAYSNLWLVGRNEVNDAFQILGWVNRFRKPHLAAVPETLHVNPQPRQGLALKSARLFNTCRFRLYEPSKKPPCRVRSDLPGMNVIHAAAGPDTVVDLYTGASFPLSTSYWIYARIEGAAAGRTRFRIHYSPHGGAGMGSRLFWSADRRTWQAIGAVGGSMGLGFDFEPVFVAPSSDFYLASSIPFLEAERDELFAEMRGDRFVTIDEIGRTVLGRTIHCVRITDPEAPNAGKRHVIFQNGQHSPLEMIGGHLLRPMWQYLRERPRLMKQMVLYFIPIVNVDCAHFGTDGENAEAVNTNRCWLADFTPETKSIRDYFLQRFEQGVQPDVFVDLHAAAGFTNFQVFAYPHGRDPRTYPGGCANPDGLRQRFPDLADQLIRESARFYELLERHAGIRRADACFQGFRDCFARDFFKNRFPHCQAFTLELSSTTYFDPTRQAVRFTDPEAFRIVGPGLVRAIAEFLDINA